MALGMCIYIYLCVVHVRVVGTLAEGQCAGVNVRVCLCVVSVCVCVCVLVFSLIKDTDRVRSPSLNMTDYSDS